MVVQNTKRDDVCRVMVIGSNRGRLNRIFSSLILRHSTGPGTIETTKQPSGDVRIEYLPCLAKFSVYERETKEIVRYLERVEYYSPDSNGILATAASSLLPFFDQDNAQVGDSLFPLIAGVAIGGGIENNNDAALIESFIETMLSGNANPTKPKLKMCKPHPNYKSMSEELAAYKQLSYEGKEEANRLQTMGPEKMVKFLIDFANEIIVEALEGKTKQNEAVTNSVEALNLNNVSLPAISEHRFVDESKNRYFCRICRIDLFGEDDLQNPPHDTSRHHFSYRKIHHSNTEKCVTDACQSYFLQESLKWMGDDINTGVSEGKFNCPKCSAKIGSWVWSGTQCSCGTWIVPAIQIPKSKVDVVRPTALFTST